MFPVFGGKTGYLEVWDKYFKRFLLYSYVFLYIFHTKVGLISL
jgi:hypothetical protein